MTRGAAECRIGVVRGFGPRLRSARIMERANRQSVDLLGRRRECAVLDGAIADAKNGRSGVLVLDGEAGIGKTVLLDRVGDRASGCRVARVAGIESEAEMAFGGLHQLCAPLRDRFGQLPEPQRRALETAFGIAVGDPPDRFLIGLATLNLLADVAADQPLVCLVDDAHWLDQISAQTLAFVARRLLAERIVLLFAMRRSVDGHPLQDLPRLPIVGLGDRDARMLLAKATPSRLDDRVRDRILGEAHGNPLALLELPREYIDPPPADGEIGGAPPANRLEAGFLRRLNALPGKARLLALLAAAEPVGDVALLRRAAAALGIDLETAGAEAQSAGLFSVRTMVRFRHPLVRSVAYRSAAAADRRRVHRALAEATDPQDDPDRRAWHLSAAVEGTDENVAADLERAAQRAGARGGVAAAATFLERAARITPDPARRASRSLAAAQATSRAGEFGAALELLDTVQLQPLDEHERALAGLIRGQILFSSRSAGAGLPLLLDAAKVLERLDPTLAITTYRDAIYAALTAGFLPGDTGVERVARAILAMPPAWDSARSEQLLRGLALVVVQGYPAGVPLVQRGLAGYRDEQISLDERLGWLPLAGRMAHNAWEFDIWSQLSAALVESAEEAGALGVLPSALLLRLSNRVYAGDLDSADSLAAQAATLGEAIGSSFFANYGELVVAPWHGDEARVRRAVDAITNDLRLRGEGKVLTATEWSASVLYNALGRYEEALEAGRRGAGHPAEMGLSTWSMIELIEAAAKLGIPEESAAQVEHIAAMATASGTDWALGTAAYVSALVCSGPEAEAGYQEAIERLDRCGVRMLGARAHLVYGEWLRQQERRAEARHRLQLAHRLLTETGAAGFAERARRELAGLGVATRGPRTDSGATLTDQELQIARLAADGLTNPEIGARMFLSAHTVEWHLRKVFAKLGIRSRRDIAAALAG